MSAAPVADRLVEVITDLGVDVDERYTYGSGCVVGGRTVLTSAHVVAGAQHVEVRNLNKQIFTARHDPRFIGDPGGWRSDGSAGPDLALIFIEDSTWVDVPRVGYGQINRNHSNGGPVDRVRAIGFPWFAERQRSTAVRSLVEVGGCIPLLSGSTDGRFSVEVTLAPPSPPDNGAAPESQWSGMSGAPVFVAGRLVAVIAEHEPREGDSTIKAIPLTALQFDPKHPLWGPGVVECADWWKCLGVGGADALVMLPAADEAGYAARLREIGNGLHRRMPRLLGRQHELAAIAGFANGSNGYQWWTGGAFTGKTALLYTAMTAGLPDDVDVVAYFLSRTASDADGGRFLEAIVPQLEILCRVEPGPRDRDRFVQLWQLAEQVVAADDRHLLLIVDGLDEDLRPAGQPPVTTLLPTVVGSRSHVLVSSRPNPDLRNKLIAQHPLAACPLNSLGEFEGAAVLADEARAEIDSLIHDDELALDTFGLLTAAGGPLTIGDLARLHADPNPPSAWTESRIRQLVEVEAARSLETTGSPDEPSYKFAHASLLEHALASNHLGHIEYRARIHHMGEQYRDLGWPAHARGGQRTPRYFLDAYPASLAGDDDHPKQFPPDPRRLAALGSDIAWATTALDSAGVDRLLGTLRTALALEPNNIHLAEMRAVVAAAAPNLAGNESSFAPQNALTELCWQATQFGLLSLANRLRELSARRHLAYLIPIWTNMPSTMPSVELGRHGGGVRAVATFDDGRVVSGGHDGRVRVWNPQHPGDPLELGRHDGSVRSVTLIDSGRVASGGNDGRVRVWNLDRPGDPLELGHHSAAVMALAVVDHGRIVSCDGAGEVRMWDTRRPGVQRKLSAPPGRWRLVMGIDDRRVVCCTGFGPDSRICVWNLRHPRDSMELTGHNGWLRAVAVIDSNHVISGQGDHLWLWDLGSPSEPLAVAANDCRVAALAVADDGCVVSGGWDGRVRVQALQRPECWVELGAHDAAVEAVAVIDADRFVSGGEDGRLRVWVRQHPDGTVERDAHPLTAVAVIDGNRFVSGGEDGRLRVWDTRHPGDSRVIGQVDGPVHALVVIDDRRVVSGGGQRHVATLESTAGQKAGQARPARDGEYAGVGRRTHCRLRRQRWPGARVGSGPQTGPVRAWRPRWGPTT